MRTLWFKGSRFLGEFNSPETYGTSANCFICIFCGEIFARVVPVENPSPVWYPDTGNCGCRKYKLGEYIPFREFRLWRWNEEETPPPLDLLAEEFLYELDQIDLESLCPHQKLTSLQP